MYILYFIIYSFLGWIIDTGYRSVLAKSFAPNSITFLPFAPIYGFGALFVLLAYPRIQHLSFLTQFIIFSFSLTLGEYIGGVLTLHFLGKRLWDYSDMPFNFQGHISLLNSFIWGILALILVTYIHPHLQKMAFSFFQK